MDSNKVALLAAMKAQEGSTCEIPLATADLTAVPTECANCQ